MKEYTLTIVGFVVAFAVFAITIIFDWDLFEILINCLGFLEKYEVDELIISFFIIVIFGLLDQLRRKKQQKIELEKIKIYEAMMASTHYILNNFLNQMLIFKMTAKKTPGFDPDVLNLYEEIIDGTSLQIEALGSITNVDEASIQASIAPN